MRKLRERLNNRKGFTLVELIVVIVIILILAAVLIPNVMRYIGQAREAAFQSEASGYLTEITGYAAECYAKTDKDVIADDFGTAEDDDRYVLTKGIKPSITVLTKSTTSTPPLSAATGNAGTKTIKAEVYQGAVISFSYTDGTHYVSWQVGKGWTNVDSNAFR